MVTSLNAALVAKRLGGDVVGKGRVLCPGPGHSARDRSLSVTLSGSDFLVHSFAGDDWKDCRDHVADLLGTVGKSRFRLSEVELRKVQEEEYAQAAKKETLALTCWREAKPIGGTAAETYLRLRGITCELPDTLRFHPACRHPSNRHFPAMVALVEGSRRTAIHRTYLRVDGSGKADVETAKAMLGSVAGGAVRLSASGGLVVVCEGIETGLSLLSGIIPGAVAVWAALSTSGMKGLVLPDLSGSSASLLVATDGDEAGRVAGTALATRAAMAGWSVSLLPAPDGYDWNDVLMTKGVAA